MMFSALILQIHKNKQKLPELFGCVCESNQFWFLPKECTAMSMCCMCSLTETAKKEHLPFQEITYICWFQKTTFVTHWAHVNRINDLRNSTTKHIIGACIPLFSSKLGTFPTSTLEAIEASCKHQLVDYIPVLCWIIMQ